MLLGSDFPLDLTVGLMSINYDTLFIADLTRVLLFYFIAIKSFLAVVALDGEI